MRSVRLPTLSVLAMSLCMMPALQAQDLSTSANSGISSAAQALQPKVLAWRRDIHQHPELSNREERTGKLVAEHLRKLGLKPRTGIAGHGITAVLKGGKPGPKVVLRADMDALPVVERVDLPFASKVKSTYNGESVGVMHACGHDAHTSILMGVAEALVKMRDQLPGEVMFLFQPAEEGAPPGEKGGASEMLAQGIFNDFKPDAVFGLHVFSTLNAGQVGVRQGPLMAASDRFTITIKGRQTHGSRPWGGIDPVVTAANVISTAQNIVSRRQDITRQPAVVTFGTVKGGVRYNIIPDQVELSGTIRTFDEGMRKDIFKQLADTATLVAQANGATAENHVPAEDGNPVTVNDPALTARMTPSLERAVGKGNVVELPLTTGAEDFAFYAQQVPSMFFFVGATPKGQDAVSAPSNHSPEFFLDESALDVGLRAMLQVTLDFLEGGAGAAKS